MYMAPVENPKVRKLQHATGQISIEVHVLKLSVHPTDEEFETCVSVLTDAFANREVFCPMSHSAPGAGASRLTHSKIP